MKLSEAILKGSIGKNQCVLNYTDDLFNAVCALGAIARGTGIYPREICSFFPQLDKRIVNGMRLFDQIAKWNDDERLTFEQISTKLKEMGE